MSSHRIHSTTVFLHECSLSIDAPCNENRIRATNEIFRKNETCYSFSILLSLSLFSFPFLLLFYFLCIKFEANSESKAPFLEFMSSAERGQFFNRCMKYELDDSQPQKLQLFDLPFNNHGIYTITGMFIEHYIWFFF